MGLPLTPPLIPLENIVGKKDVCWHQAFHAMDPEDRVLCVTSKRYIKRGDGAWYFTRQHWACCYCHTQTLILASFDSDLLKQISAYLKNQKFRFSGLLRYHEAKYMDPFYTYPQLVIYHTKLEE